MNRKKIFFRKHIFLFIKNEIIILWLYFLFYYFLTFYINYESIQDHSPLRYILYMDLITWLIFILSGLIISGIIFFRWYIDTIIIYSKFITFKKGILGTKKIIYFKDIVDVKWQKSYLGEMFNFGCIILEQKNNIKPVKLCYIPSVEQKANLIKKKINLYKNNLTNKDFFQEMDIQNLIKNGENEFVEFKQSLRWDFKQNSVNKKLENVILKTIVGFMNANGGVLFIGVDDNGAPVGLENDYKTLKKYGKDYFEIHLRNLIISHIGKEFLGLVDIFFPVIDKKEICVVKVLSEDNPAFLNINGEIKFYVRFGNSTQQLDVKEAISYVKLRF